MKNLMNTKYVAALAVFAMMFAGFGVILADEGADATIITKEGIAITYDNDDAGLVAVATAKLDLSVVSSEKTPIQVYTEFAGEIWAFNKDASIIFTIPYTIASGKTLADYVPASLIQDYTDKDVVVTVKYVSESDTTLAVAMDELKRVLAIGDITYDHTKAAVKMVLPLAADVSAYSNAELLEMIVDAEEAVKAEYADYFSPDEAYELVNKAIDAAIEQYIAEHPVKEDNTTLWMCVAAVFGIAAVALGIFLVVALVKAKKEGRRFI